MDQPVETQNQDGDLQDLSANDADELNAFLAKRKWFEVKLKVGQQTSMTDLSGARRSEKNLSLCPALRRGR
jgi:hypothetical protein